MKLKLPVLLVLLLLVFTACEKEYCEKECKIDLCSSDEFTNPEIIPEGFEQIIVEAPQLNPDCGCYTEGYVKYVNIENPKFFALVKYESHFKDGKCYSYGYKFVCEGDDCDWEDEDDDYEDNDDDEEDNYEDDDEYEDKDDEDCKNWCKFTQVCSTDASVN